MAAPFAEREHQGSRRSQPCRFNWPTFQPEARLEGPQDALTDAPTRQIVTLDALGGGVDISHLQARACLAGWRCSVIWGITGDRHGAGSGGFDDLVARVFLDGEKAFIAEFPRHVLRYLDFVARRIQ